MSVRVKAELARASGFTLDVDIQMQARVSALYGPSGAGKTTVLRLIAGIERLSRGDTVEVTFEDEIWHSPGRTLPPHKRGVGYLFQDLQLFEHLTVAGNLGFAAKRRSGEVNESQILTMLDLNHLTSRSIGELSGGERQRVAIARALFANPRLLLMDEPLGSIDTAARARILPYLQRMQAELDLPIIYVSHAIDEVNFLAEEVHRMEAGRLKKSSRVTDFASDLEVGATEPDAAVIVRCQVLRQDTRFELTQADFEGQALYLAATHYPEGSTLNVSIPARDVSVSRTRPTDSSILNVLDATVSEIHVPQHGASSLVRLKCGEQFLLARITRMSLDKLALKEGDAVLAQVKGVALITDLDQ